MTQQVYGARRPVFSGSRRIPGLFERDLAGGQTVYDAKLRLGGSIRRFRLTAPTKTDAVAELAALRVDHARGDLHRSAAAGLTVADLSRDYVANLETHIGDRDPKRRRSARTVEDTRYKLERYVLPVLGRVDASALTAPDVVRLLDRLAARGLAPKTRSGVLSVLSGLLRFGVKRGAVERNVVADVDRDDR